MHYLSERQILFIHSAIIDETGGTYGVRDRQAILSLAALPRQAAFGKELYPDIFLKAAVYARNIINGHPFIDGNKRTGVTFASVFLENNGYKIIAKEGEIEKFALKIINDKLDLKSIADWFKNYSKKI